ncbi:O-antigen ligase family protein [Corallococcus llansteffanensis]|uniref:O-antigen ligase domain-containing protein n=1 Tax=Corallococcus llansteffanensis TaxID=2316731 RepID=A0A3A8QHC8_9BACT|nr:O-antigen ligase family protein [Corallococcus llansteffanensis]RKH68007.1 O-antigen ligase domain-containing protein [Corallococcus llansteffanensis]
MAPESRRASRYTLSAEAALAALLVLGPVALGGAARWVSWPLGVLAGLAAVLAVLGARRQGESPRVPLLAAPLVGGVLLCALQLVPLPPAVLGWVSPEAAALREDVLVPLGLTGFRPVSLDPSATWRELAKHGAYLLTFLAAVQVCRVRASRKRLLTVLAFTGAAVAAVGLGHALFGVETLFGLRAYVHARPPLVTPFGNPNHLAGFLGLAATVAVGLALSKQSRAQAWPFAAAALVSGAGVLLSLSRAGIVFFVFGQVLLAGWLSKQRREARTPARPSWGRGAAVLLGLLATLSVGVYLAADQLWAEARTADSVESLRHGKVEPWPMMARAARAFPVLGMGRGAFEAAFPRYQTEPNPNTFTHPENAVLQVATEWGVPGVLLLALGLWGFVLLVRREGHGPVDLAALSGVAALALHNLFDFSLELPACAVAVAVALGAVARPRDAERMSARRTRTGALPTGPALALAAGLAAVVLVALVPGARRMADAEGLLADRVSARAPGAEVRALGLSLIDAHPADYLLYRLVAMASVRDGAAGAQEALAFVNRALYLRPLDAPSHRVAARALLHLGRRAQGFLEYRLSHEAGDTRVLLSEALPLARTPEELRTLTPEAPGQAPELAAALLAVPERRALGLAWLAWAREHFEGRPEATALWMHETRGRLAQGELPAAEAACAEVERRAPDALATHLLRADVWRAQGRGAEALQALEALAKRFPHEVELAFTLAARQQEAGLTRRSRDTLDAVAPFLTNLQQRARLLSLEADCFEREGLLARALEQRRSVVGLQPGPDSHFAVARLQELLARYDAAARSVHEGLRLMPPGAGSRRAEAEAWATRLEAHERARVDARRRERVEDPRARELEPAPPGSMRVSDSPAP